MSPSSAPFDPCDGVEADGAQEQMAPFLRPTIGPNDRTWVNVASMGYQDKKNLIEYATTTELPPPALGASGVSPSDDREDANTFGTAILAEFDQYLANNDIVDEYYCAAVNFLAFAKWSDLDAFERIERGDFVGRDGLDKQCEEMLNAAVNSGLIPYAPTAHILNFPRIEVRIFPYTSIIAIFLNPKRPLIPEVESIADLLNAIFYDPETRILAELLLTISHEVAHYLFWNGQIGGKAVEAWVRDKIAGLGADEQGEAYRYLEELFCDAIGVVAGGFPAAEAMIAAIGKVLTPNTGYFGRVRYISILRRALTFFDEHYEDLKAKANVFLTWVDASVITDDDVNRWSEPYLDPIESPEMQEILGTFHEGTSSVRAVIDNVSSPEVTSEVIGQVEGLEDEERQNTLLELFFAKLVEIGGGPTSTSSSTTGGPTGAAASFDPADLIQKFKEQWSSAPPLDLFPDEWFGVLLAAGWSNRPTKNNIGTKD